MSGETEAGSSSKQDSTEPDCNAENILTSSTNYVTPGRESPIATFQALKVKSENKVGTIGTSESNILSAAVTAANLNLVAATAASNIPLINSNEINKITNNNNNVINPNKKLFECDVCNMKFSNGANMRRHKMRHTGVKPYECRVCQKRFFRKDHLSEHFTTHIKTLPFHCPICNRGFQRQIAMRAHFQNEHVGQHDLVKTCPLCHYRAGTMKSLRVHFFNRHGIDLDNPGSNASSSLLLALEQQQQNLPVNLMQAANLAAAAAAFSESAAEVSRAQDNATPPMHYLTPHVEISMADNNETIRMGSPNNSVSSGLDIQAIVRPKSNPTPPQQTTDAINRDRDSGRQMFDSSITPSISLIPIKQEPSANEESEGSGSGASGSINLSNKGRQSSSERMSPLIEPSSCNDAGTSSQSLTALIKVSPLKSLLREDLKRRISARAIRSSSRAGTINVSNSGPTNLSISAMTSVEPIGVNSLSNAITGSTGSNGMITSTGEAELIITGRKLNLKCLFCNIEFPDQTLYFLHKGCHSESNAWKCNICGEQLNNVYEFNSHLLSKSHQ